LYINIKNINNNNGDKMIDFGHFFPVLFRSLVSLVTLFIVAKIIGKKQISELSLFDYVIGISIGNFAAEMTINLDSPEFDGILAVFIFGFIAYLVSYLSMKSVFIRRYFMGTPTMIIQEGKIIKKNMKKAKMDINDLLEEARIKGYFDLSELQYGIMEANGEMSFLPYPMNKPATVGDINGKVKVGSLQANIIIDGKIMKKNLKKMNKDLDWLNKELAIKGYKEQKKILLCTLDKEEKFIFYIDDENIDPLNVLE
jgi:Predicted membrane protein